MVVLQVVGPEILILELKVIACLSESKNAIKRSTCMHFLETDNMELRKVHVCVHV